MIGAFRYLRLAVLLLPLWLLGCASAPPKDPSAARFCDGYFIYVMCAEDITGDGVSDIMFFDDDKQIFMYHPSVAVVVEADYALHRCAMQMDEVTREITTEMIAVDDETPLLTKLDLKKRLLVRYNQRRHEMDECNARYADPEEMNEEPFGNDEDFADFPEDDLDKG